MTRLKGTKLLPRVAWLAGDCFVQLIVIATLTMEQELVSALCSEYTIIPSYTPRPPHYQHLLLTAAAAALSSRHLSKVSFDNVRMESRFLFVESRYCGFDT